MLAHELERAKINLWNAGEERLTRALPLRLPQIPLAEDVSRRWHLFVAWAETKEVRSLPAKPATVAAFIVDQSRAGIGIQNLIAILSSVELAHDTVNLGNPVRCALPRAALEQIIKIDPPRSWPKEEKAAFALLPPDIREVIGRREQERDTALRRPEQGCRSV